MIVLAQDSSTRVSSIALFCDGATLSEIILNTSETHSTKLLPAFKYLLEKSGISLNSIDLLATTIGPGSFTAMRIGLSFIKALSFSLKKSVYTLSSLKLLAWNLAYSKYQICPAIDAKKGELYAAIYKFDKTNMRTIIDEQSISPLVLSSIIKVRTLLIGDGITKYQNEIKQRVKSNAILADEFLHLPRASILASLAYRNFAGGKKFSHNEFESFEPTYLRLSPAEINNIKK